MFSKQHYVAIADLLRNVRENEVRNHDEVSLIDSVIYHFEDLFERDNPNFDGSRFLEAAGMFD